MITLSLVEAGLAIIALVGVVVGGGGFVAWRNSSIEESNSVSKQLGELNTKLKDEIKRLDDARDDERVDFERKFKELSDQAQEREQNLLKQIAALREENVQQKKAAEAREQALQDEITGLRKTVASQAQQIYRLQEQQKTGKESQHE